VAGLLSSDPAFGFLAVNAALVTLGLWCWAVPARTLRGAAGLILFCSVLEFVNGVNHSVLALWRRGYFPGVITAPPLLLVFPVRLAALQARSRQ